MKFNRTNNLAALSAVSLLLGGLTVSMSLADGPIVAVVSNDEVSAYRQVVKGFKAAIVDELPEVKFVDLTDEIAQKPALVFAVGSASVRRSLDKLNDVELVATMILNDELLKQRPQTTSILLQHSPLIQLQWHRRLLPQVKRVGILYDPKYNQTWVDAAKIDAAQLGLEIVAIPVFSAKNLSAALRAIGRQADSIMSIADQTVYSGKTAKTVLLFSFRNRIPFVGLSEAWVKAGALYALDWDYQDLGRQSGDIALKTLKGEQSQTAKSQLPANTLYQLNLKTAEQLKLKISQEYIDGAAKVYQ